MPVTAALTTSTIRLVNTAFTKGFFPRAMRSYWPRVCGTTKSSSMYEPFAFMGAAPMLRYFQGIVSSNAIPSYSFQVPNPVWKNYEVIKRNMFEFDQTRTLNSRVGQHGIRVAQLTDYLLANVIVRGDQANSQYFANFDDGVTYTMTYDKLPMFAPNHNIAGTNFSNILTGNLPDTAALVASQDITVTANQLQRDMILIETYIGSLVDNTGAKLYPDFDAERQLILMFPPCLGPGAKLAFTTDGTLGGSAGSSSGSTTNIGRRLVKDIIVWNLLQSCPDMTTGVPNGNLLPTNATQYYFCIDGDYIKPFYFQRFMPIQSGQTIPMGENPEAQAQAIINSLGAKGIDVRPEDAEVYAATEVDTNLGALGQNSQESVMAREEFIISSRSRQMVYGSLWFTFGLVAPSGQST